MTPWRFAALLRGRGPGLHAWPPTERDAALRLLRRSGRARRLLADTLATAEDAAEAGDAALAARLQAGLARRLDAEPPPARPPVRPPVRPWPAPARRALPSGLRLPAFRPLAPAAFGWGALAASFALGAWLGLANPLPSPGGTPDLLAATQITPISLGSP